MISAIILAAGDSSRMGRTKALLEYKGATFLGTALAGAKAAGAGETIVVLGANRAEVLAAWRPKEEKIAFNGTPELGQIASVRAGLKMAGPEAEAAMICLVDQPLIKPETYKLIAGFWRLHKDFLVIPRCRREAGQPWVTSHRSQVTGQNSDNSTLHPLPSTLFFKRGHPIIIPRRYFQLCFDGPAGKGLHWVTHHPSVTPADLTVEDGGIIRDFDTPEEYSRLPAGDR
ncbi:MAG: hypothetical protein A2X28_10625 [Elusimicrobia bacterium GWA2_56_46]|nr:MAG: hypothetical protein A2X28_10625 [Elusimicrobia bacterium GWA2_56_46]OGR55095.1 MAG: hypothetical protein A2X39_09535 [Elusimicrobia bacterium GWC2_56_31]HBB66310.1 hypothetical protein [Elusimicrobiota bacterium]HBW23817.1 hypothetical protein [Elusimicrobiota bacterium]